MNFLKKFTVVALAAVALTACSDDDPSNAATVGGPKIRVVNSTYKIATPTDAVVPVAIDFMIDSNTTTVAADVEPAAFDDIPGNSIASMTPTSTSASSTSEYWVSNTDNGFEEFDVGVHSYVAREADSTSGRTAQLYINSANSGPYLPRQYLTAGTYYTWIIAGVIPKTGSVSGTAAPNVFTFAALVDDPFPPPTLSNGTYQARFRVINAAPFLATTATSNGSGNTATVYLTPDAATPPATGTGAGTIGSFTSLGSAGYRAGSAYINVTAGTYWLTIARSTTTIVWQGRVTVAAGDVRTFILQNNITNVAGTTPTLSTAVYKLTNILDQKY